MAFPTTKNTRQKRKECFLWKKSYFLNHLARDLVWHLGHRIAKSSFDLEDYSVYTQVPMHALSLDDVPMTSYENITLDLLICIESKVILAVLLDKENDTEALADGPLRDIQFLNLSMDDGLRDVSRHIQRGLPTAEQLFTYEGSPLSLELTTAEYVLRFLPGCRMSVRDLMVSSCQLTPEAAAAGLFLMYACDNGEQRPVVRLSLYGVRRMVETLFPYPKCDGRDAAVSLEIRLRRLDMGLPSSDAAARRSAAGIREMLDIPLSSLSHVSPSRWVSAPERQYRTLCDKLREGTKALCQHRLRSEKLPIPQTVGQALEMVCRLRRISAVDDPQSSHLRQTYKDILNALGAFCICPASTGKAADPRSLQKRLGKNSGQSLLCPAMELTPLQYFQGIAALTGSMFPLVIYRDLSGSWNNFMGQTGQNPALGAAADIIRYVMRSHEPNPSVPLLDIPDPLYDLMVAPLFES